MLGDDQFNSIVTGLSQQGMEVGANHNKNISNNNHLSTYRISSMLNSIDVPFANGN
jgi:hypothetical protein